MENEPKKNNGDYRKRLQELAEQGKCVFRPNMPKGMQMVFESLAYEYYAYDNFPESWDEKITNLLDDKKELQGFLINVIRELYVTIFDSQLDIIFGEDSDIVADQDKANYFIAQKEFEKRFGFGCIERNFISDEPLPEQPPIWKDTIPYSYLLDKRNEYKRLCRRMGVEFK